jgi:hypothetical protein
MGVLDRVEAINFQLIEYNSTQISTNPLIELDVDPSLFYNDPNAYPSTSPPQGGAITLEEIPVAPIDDVEQFGFPASYNDKLLSNTLYVHMTDTSQGSDR